MYKHDINEYIKQTQYTKKYVEMLHKLFDLAGITDEKLMQDLELNQMVNELIDLVILYTHLLAENESLKKENKNA